MDKLSFELWNLHLIEKSKNNLVFAMDFPAPNPSSYSPSSKYGYDSGIYSINDNYPSNGAVLCGACGYTKNHHILDEENDKNHYTCICLLNESFVVCCLRGYENLLSYIPSMALYSPSPQAFTDDYIMGQQNVSITMSNEKYNKILGESAAVKMSALSEYQRLKKPVLAIRFID